MGRSLLRVAYFSKYFLLISSCIFGIKQANFVLLARPCQPARLTTQALPARYPISSHLKNQD
jgi:hypothetical protein